MWAGGVTIFIVVILHNVCGLALGYLIAAALRLAEPKRRALCIEVGMQNSGLASSLAVMHFAAYALVGESSADPGKYFRNNDIGGIQLAESMKACGVTRIVFSSTCATYGQPDAMPITEDTPQRPTNPYGESKLLFERMLGWYQRIHGFRPVFLRYFNACGAEGNLGEDREIETHIIPNVLRVPQSVFTVHHVFSLSMPRSFLLERHRGRQHRRGHPVNEPAPVAVRRVHARRAHVKRDQHARKHLCHDPVPRFLLSYACCLNLRMYLAM